MKLIFISLSLLLFLAACTGGVEESTGRTLSNANSVVNSVRDNVWTYPPKKKDPVKESDID